MELGEVNFIVCDNYAFRPLNDNYLNTLASG